MATILLLCISLALPAAAAERWADLVDTVFQNYGREQGLPHPVPTALAEDGDGFLWVGTQGGLARWDGYRFHAYHHAAGNPASLPDDWIQTLHTDPTGHLWVGTSAGGLARYDREHDRFVAVALDQSATARVHIGAITDDGAGGLWIGTETGLDHLEPATGAVAALHHADAVAGSLPDEQVQAVLRDRAGRLWVGTAKGLAWRDAGSETFVPVPFGEANASVAALCQTEDGRIWIGTAQNGLSVLDSAGGAPRPIEVPDPAGSSRSDDDVSAITAANDHELWVATRGGGIVVVDTATFATRRIRHDRALPSSLAHDDIWALLRDDAGALWVGGTGGLSYHAKDLGAVATVFGGSGRPNGLSGADVYSVLPARNGRVWLGYLSGGVDLVDSAAGRVGTLRPDPARPDTALPQDVVTAMAEADAGVYLGTVRGLYRADTAGTGVAFATVPRREAQAPVSTLLYDAGLLWVGGYYDGLWALKPGGGLVFGPDNAAGLSDPGVNTLRRGTGRDLWVGTRNGLDRIDLDTLAVERIMPDPGDPAALPARFVSTLALDRQGRLWAGTLGGGIAVMTGRDAGGRPRFRRLGVADGLPHATIDTLLVDGRGTVWAGTDDGLAMVDPASFAIRALHRSEGAALADYFAGSGAVDDEGEPLFGAIGGLTIVRGPVPHWDFHPPVVVTDVRIGGVPVAAGRFNGGGSADPLVLTPEAGSLAVEFSSLDFTAPARNRYAYRLDGFDRDWIETDPTRRLAAYTNLPPGSYSLRLRGSNRLGAWTPHELVLPIRVLPAWYQTLWFKLVAALAGIAGMVVFVRSRTAYLRHRQRRLERQVADRTADLRAANDQLFELATTDPLTGCANRRHFAERAGELLALGQRNASPTSLAILDLDNFKRINDSHGHPAGDAVLRMAGRTCQTHIRGTDLLGRMGGEEFAVLMPGTAAAGAALLADRLREAIRQEEAVFDGAVLRITASLGVAELAPGETFDALYARADAALYTAKAAGRDRVVVSEALAV